MLDGSPRARETSVARPLSLAERPVLAAPLVDVVRNARSLRLLLECLGMVGTVAVQAFLGTVQQLAEHVHIGHIRTGRDNRVHQPRIDVGTGMHLHAEVPLLALARLMHLGIARLLGILRRRRRVDDVASTIVPLPSNSPRSLRWALISTNSCSVSLCFSSSRRKLRTRSRLE